MFLFSGLTARQIVLIAGRNLLVEKNVAFSEFQVNDPGFEQARAAARASDRDHVPRDRRRPSLLREAGRHSRRQRASTTQQREGDGDGRHHRSLRTRSRCRSSASTIWTSSSATRTRSSRCCLQASWPRGTFSGRSSGRPRSTRASISSPSPCHRAIASTTPGGEREGERVLTWPLSTGLNLGWQYTPFQKATSPVSVPVRRLRARPHDSGDVPAARRAPSPTASAAPGSTGAADTASSRTARGFAAHVAGLGTAGHERRSVRGFVRRPRRIRSTGEPVARFLLQGLPQGAPERRLVRRRAISIGSRSISSACSTTRGFTACRRRACGSASSRWPRGSYSFNIFDLYRLDLFVEQAWGRDRALDRGLAADQRIRRRRQRPGAVEYDPARRRRQEPAAAALPRRRVGDAADSSV